ncbi:MAG: glycosyltransferase, partial [Solirubrobacteraceae bacterium]
MSERPAVDVVLPFRGSDEQLERVAERLAALDLRRGDSVTIADNRPAAAGAQRGSVAIIPAGERQTSYFARNRGAARGQAPWLIFLDADVTPPPDLLDRYFATTPPADDVGVLAGAVIDEPASEGETATAAERYAWLKSSMSQEITLASGEWAFAQTAKAAVRRAAFEQVGGFEDSVRSGGDADLC